MRFLLSFMLFAVSFCGVAQAAPTERCLPSAQAQAAVQSHHLVAPNRAVSAARRVSQGELLAARLCENDGNYVYMLHVLGQNGQVRRVVVDAKSAEVVGPK